jgi:hypothetical protein
MAQGGNTWVGATNFGQITVSTDLQNWYNYDPEHKTWLINQISWGNNQIVAVGHEKNPASLAETGFIAVSTTGGPATWVRKYVSYQEPMCLFSVKYLGGNNWIAVGGKNDLSTPVCLYSSDGAETWTPISLPSILTSAIYSVEASGIAQTQVWLGGKGWVAYSSNWQGSNTVWTLNDSIKDNNQNKAVTKIYYRDTLDKELAVALTGSTLWYSADKISYQSLTKPGYQFLDANNFYNSTTQESVLYVSVGGLMNQYTGFKTSWVPNTTQEFTLTGFNNGVQAHSLIVV